MSLITNYSKKMQKKKHKVCCSKLDAFILDNIEEQIGRRTFNFIDECFLMLLVEVKRRGAYLCDHHNDEAVLNNLVVGDRLDLIFHDFAIGDEFLC